MTLGTVPILQVMLHPFIIRLPISLLGVIVAIGKLISWNLAKLHRSHSRPPAHQVSLSYAGLMQYVLHAPRTSLVSSNKEGLVSVTGMPICPSARSDLQLAF